MKAADPANAATIQAQYDALTDSSVPPAGQQGAAQNLAATWQAQQAAQQAANLPPSPGGGGAGGGVSQQASQPAGTPVQNAPPSQWTQADVDALKAANPAFANNLQLLFDAANDQSVPDSTRADAAQQLAAAWQATQLAINPPPAPPAPPPPPASPFTQAEIDAIKAVNPNIGQQIQDLHDAITDPNLPLTGQQGAMQQLQQMRSAFGGGHGTAATDLFNQQEIDHVRTMNLNDASRIEGIQNSLRRPNLSAQMEKSLKKQLQNLRKKYPANKMPASANPAPNPAPVNTAAANANTANPTQPAPANGAQGGTTYSAAPAAQSPVGWGLPHQNAPAQGVPGNVGASSGSVTPAVLPPPPQRSAAGESWGGGSASNGTTGAATYSPPPANTQGQSVAPANAATPPSPGGSTPNSAAGQANPTPAPSPTGGGVNGSAPSYSNPL